MDADPTLRAHGVSPRARSPHSRQRRLTGEANPARATRFGAAWLTGACVVASVAWAGACRDAEHVVEAWEGPAERSVMIVSDPVSGTSPAGVGAAVSLSAASDIAYVSLPPGTIPDGERASIRNPRTGSTAQAVMVDGGFDPVPVEASAGDTLELEVEVTGSDATLHFALAVPLARRPIVVRTDPPPQKRDVPLNQSMLVVFSEPIDPLTLTEGSVQLLRGTEPVAGRLEFRDAEHLTAAFVPEAPLAQGTVYTLLVTQGILDLDGEPLEAAVSVEFATVEPAAGPQLAFAAQPTNMGASLVMTPHVQVSARDTFGNTDLSFTGMISIALGNDPAGGSLTGTTSVAAIAGVATFTDLRIDAAGIGYTLVATSEGFAEDTSREFDILPFGPLTGQIAFARCRHPFCQDTTWDIDLYVVTADGSAETRLTNDSSGSELHPAWSRDGSRIVFTSYRDNNYAGIDVISGDGSSRSRLTGAENGSGDETPAWSPDGSKIVFVSARDAGDRDVYIMNADGSGPARVANQPAGDAHWPTWSPDGTKIVFVNFIWIGGSAISTINVMNLDGSGLTQLAVASGIGLGFLAPALSPDGVKIAFANRESSINGEWTIYVMHADGSGVTRLTSEPGIFHAQAPAWSPDGTRIAFVALRDGNWDIYAMNADGSGVVRLTYDPGTDFSPAWSPGQP